MTKNVFSLFLVRNPTLNLKEKKKKRKFCQSHLVLPNGYFLK